MIGFVGSQARSLLKQLLKRDPSVRLGSGSDDAKPIKAHPFFASKINWTKLLNKQVRAPFVPKIKGETDTSNFDVEFTSEKVVDSVVPTSHLAGADADFSGFTFKENSHMG